MTSPRTTTARTFAVGALALVMAAASLAFADVDAARAQLAETE